MDNELSAHPELSTPTRASTLDAFFTAQGGALPTEDVLHVILPLMRSVAALHERSRVASLGLHDILETPDGAFALVRGEGQSPISNQSALQRVQPQSNSGLKIVGEYRVTNDEGVGTKVEDLRTESGEDLGISKPIYRQLYT